jgi:uncharacterized protein DUF2586
MIPSLTISIKSNGLALMPPSAAQASVTLGICSDGIPNTLYGPGSPAVASTLLGQGPLVENVGDKLSVAGAGAMAMPLNPSGNGTSSAVDTTRVVGAGVLTVAFAPARSVALKIIVGGVLTTMTYAVSLNGGPYSAPIVSAAGAQLIAGTLTRVTFAAGTYVANDVYTIATTGRVTLVGSGAAASNVTHASSPLDVYDVRMVVSTTGAEGVGVFTYSLDGANNVSGQILIPSIVSGSSRYPIPESGVVLVFSGTFTANDDYRFTTTTATFTTGDVTSAITVLRGDATEWGFIHVVGMGADAAAAASMASTLDTQMIACEVSEFRYVWAAMECPTLGSITSSGVSAQSDSTVATAFQNFASERVMVCAGDFQHTSVISGNKIRRNAATAITSRIAAISVSEDPAWVGRGALKNVKSLYRDEAKTTYFDAQRFATLRTWIGIQGYYVTNGNLMAPSGSDFALVQYRRLIDVACRTARQGLLPYSSQKIRVSKKTGFIDPRDAVSIERTVNAKLNAALVAPDDAVDTFVEVSKTEPILQTMTMPVELGVLPFGYAKFIRASIGLLNPAAVAA